MKFIVKAMLVHADGTSTSQEEAATCEAHEDAIGGSGDLIDTLGEIADTDTLVVYATPVPPADKQSHDVFFTCMSENEAEWYVSTDDPNSDPPFKRQLTEEEKQTIREKGPGIYGAKRGRNDG
jgi:hypothetical protein